MAEEPIPLPAETPFDDNLEALVVYLEFYALGYRLAAAGHGNPGCLCMLDESIDYYEAAVRGMTVGVAAGMEAYSRSGSAR